MSRTKSRPLSYSLALLMLLGGVTSGSAVHAEDESKQASFVDRVNKAIDEGVNWLLAKPALFKAGKFDVAHWGVIEAEATYSGEKRKVRAAPAGPTSLALYTLLKCGVDPKHPAIERGFNWLRESHRGTEKWDAREGKGAWWRLYEICDSYQLSTIILALTAKYDRYKKTAKSMEAARKGKLKIKDRDDRKWLQGMVATLVDRRGVPGGQTRRGWRYNQPGFTIGRRTWPEGPAPERGSEDLSSTQLAALALFSAQRFGIGTDVKVWKDIANFTLDQQQDDGREHQRHDPVQPDKAPFDRARGFSYMKDSPQKSESKPTGAMTACGVANLLMAQEGLAHPKKTRKAWPKSDSARRFDTAIHDGLAWLDRNWSTFENPHARKHYDTYYLYALERAMDLLGKRLVGKNLWYEEGAEEILQRQHPVKVHLREKEGRREVSGVYWNTGTTHAPGDVLDTCFCLLFLKRATQGMVPRTAVTGGG